MGKAKKLPARASTRLGARGQTREMDLSEREKQLDRQIAET